MKQTVIGVLIGLVLGFAASAGADNQSGCEEIEMQVQAIDLRTMNLCMRETGDPFCFE